MEALAGRALQDVARVVVGRSRSVRRSCRLHIGGRGIEIAARLVGTRTARVRERLGEVITGVLLHRPAQRVENHLGEEARAGGLLLDGVAGGVVPGVGDDGVADRARERIDHIGLGHVGPAANRDRWSAPAHRLAVDPKWEVRVAVADLLPVVPDDDFDQLVARLATDLQRLCPTVRRASPPAAPQGRSCQRTEEAIGRPGEPAPAGHRVRLTARPPQPKHCGCASATANCWSARWSTTCEASSRT